VQRGEGVINSFALDVQGTSLAEVLGVATVFWSGSLTEWIYLVPDVIGKPSAIVPAALKNRFAS